MMQAITIQVVLFLHVASAWIKRHERNSMQWYDKPWFWPVFQVLYMYLSEIQPFIFFMYMVL